MYTKRKFVKKRKQNFKIRLNPIRVAVHGVFKEVKRVEEHQIRASEEHYEFGKEIAGNSKYLNFEIDK